MKLYEITHELRDVLEQLAEPEPDPDLCGWEVHGAWRVARADAQFALNALEVSLVDKLRGYVAVATELRVERETRGARIEAIEHLVLDKMRRQNEVDAKKEAWLLETAENVIKQFDVPLPIKCDEFTINLRKMPPRAMVLDASAVPPEYQRIVPEQREPDKKKILDDLKLGVLIPGVALAATSYKLAVK